MRSSLLSLFLAWMLITTLSGCSASNILGGFLSGGVPDVAANVQAGKTNTQTVGTTQNVSPTVSLRPNSRVDNLDQSSGDDVENQTINNIPVWIILLLILTVGLIIPSPFKFKGFK